MQAKIGRRFQRAELTYFKINRFYVLRQAESASRFYAKEYNFDERSSIK